jgi:syntaxin 7
MSFQDIEAGLGPHPARTQPSLNPQSREDASFLELQSSLSLQVFKMNANVQGILKLVDQLGTPKDSATLRKSLYVALSCIYRWLLRCASHDLTETTRAMAKRGSDDLKKLSVLQMSLVIRSLFHSRERY